MGKLILTVCALLVLGACDEKEQTSGQTKASAPVAYQRPQDYSIDNALNSVAFTGTYRMRGQGETFVVLNGDGTFVFHRPDFVPASGTDVGGVKTGRYVWDVTGTVITLVSDDDDLAEFFVGKTFLKQIDAGSFEGSIFEKSATGAPAP